MSRSLYSACVKKIKSMPDSIVINEFATDDASVGRAQSQSFYLPKHPMTERVDARKRIFKEALECALHFRTPEELREFIADYTDQSHFKDSDGLLSLMDQLKNTSDESERAAKIQVIIDRLIAFDNGQNCFSRWSKRRISESGLFALLIKSKGVPGNAFANAVYMECNDAMRAKKSCLAHVDPNVDVLTSAAATPKVSQKILTGSAVQGNEIAASSTTQDHISVPAAVSMATPATEQAGAVISPDADKIRPAFSVNDQKNALDLLSMIRLPGRYIDNNGNETYYLKQWVRDFSGETSRLPSALYDAVIAPQILYADFSGVAKITYNPMPVNWRERRFEIMSEAAEIITQTLINLPANRMVFNLKMTNEGHVYFNGSPSAAMLLANTNFENRWVVFEIPDNRTVENCFSYTSNNPGYSSLERRAHIWEQEQRHTLFGRAAAAAVAQVDVSTSIAPAV